MPITNQDAWGEYEKANADDYGKACVDVAREVMRLLDERPGKFDPHQIVCDADKEDDLTGFMAGCIAQMVSKCHSRGDEFRKAWNLWHQLGKEGAKANEGDGVLNPAVLNVGKT